MGVLAAPNMIVTTTNVIFFILMQTLFFIFIASKQFNVVLEDKVDILNTYLKHDPKMNQQIKAYLQSSEVRKIQQKAKEQEKKRAELNKELMMKWIGIPLAISTLILLYFVWKLRQADNQHPWTGVDTALLTLVVGAYTTEVLFYVGIVRQYKFYGDHRIYSNIYDEVGRNLIN